MERRVLLAIGLSVLVLLVWQMLFAPPPAPPPGGEAGRGAGEPPAPEQGPPPTPAGAPLVARPARPVAAGGGGTAEVVTPLYRATFGPGGGVSAWSLRYRGSKPVVVGETVPPLAVAITAPGRTPELVTLVGDRERLTLGPGAQAGELSYTGTAADGLRITKTFRFRADSYRVEVGLRAEGAGADGPVTLAVYWTSPVAIAGAAPDAPWVTFGEGPGQQQVLGRILVDRPGPPEAFEHPAPKLEDAKAPPERAVLEDPRRVPLAVLAAGPRWVALENDYYIAALIPSADAQVLRSREPDLTEVGVVFPEVRVAPGRPWRGGVTAYVGPKEWDRLSALGAGVEQAQARNYGRFLWTLPMEWFCVPLLWIMNFFATRLPGQNYGVAIILLTVLVKIAFYPLSQKSMTSMKRMQALQPQLNALRSKYKSDPQRFQREQMDLFRKHKVNPMGGCLPMVVQIPIFYALYLTLQYSVELQGAPFVLWITDLSKKDPYYVLPILMGASMFVQQKMTPTVGDPRQARIMLMMPLLFTFMFLEFPTGLVLYWFVNNLLSIGQQHLIDRATRAAKVPAGAEGKPAKQAKRA